jgi:hypothetical protein
MKRVYSPSELPNPLLTLRKAGYSPFKDPQSGDESFIIRLTSEFYPRFHLYAEKSGEGTSLSLHLDQKKPSYGTGNMHGGEYEGPAIEKEFDRINSWVKSTQRDQHTSMQTPAKVQKQTWWQKLFFGPSKR